MSSIQIARWYAAPTVAVPVLTSTTPEQSELGGRCDKEDFPKYIQRLTGDKITQESIELHWLAAIRDVEKDLRSPAFRRKIYDLASDFEKWLIAT